jgi:hypothetical protein
MPKFQVIENNGERTWITKFETGGMRVSNAAAASAIPGVVFVASSDGKLHALSSSDGRPVWEFDADREFETINRVRARGGAMGAPPGTPHPMWGVLGEINPRTPRSTSSTLMPRQPVNEMRMVGRSRGGESPAALLPPTPSSGSDSIPGFFDTTELLRTHILLRRLHPDSSDLGIPILLNNVDLVSGLARLILRVIS